MPDMLDEAKYRNEIKLQTDRELAESTALRVFFICDTCKRHSKQLADHEKNISDLQMKSTKSLTGAGAVGSGIGAGIVVALVTLFKKLGIEF